MATDYVELLDRGTAELIIRGSLEVLATIVDARTRPLTGPPVWREYFDPDSRIMTPFPEDSTPERLRVILEGESLTEVKTELIRELCTSDWLYLDYWGCNSVVFPSGDPPGATRWEDFVAPMLGADHSSVLRNGEGSEVFEKASGRYLLTAPIPKP